MKLVSQEANYIGDITYSGEDCTLNHIELCGRLCYRSETSKDIKSRNILLNSWNNVGHTSLYEHSQIVLDLTDLPISTRELFLDYLITSGLYRFADLDYFHYHILAGNLRFWLELYEKLFDQLDLFNSIFGGIKAAFPCFLEHWECDERADLIMEKEQVPWKLHRYAAHILLDRGVLTEWTRHDFGFSVESSRYCNYGKEKYGKEIQVHDQDNVGFFPKNGTVRSEECARMIWKDACFQSERAYMALLNHVRPEIARQVLNMSLITRMYVSGIPWYWDNFFELRDAKTAHPNIRTVTKDLRQQMYAADYGTTRNNG